MRLTGRKMPYGGSQRASNPVRMAVYLVVIVGGVLLTRMVEAGRVAPPFLPTPTPTSTASTLAELGRTYFSAGDLEAAIQAYLQASSLSPDDPSLLAEVARIETYSSELQPTSDQRRQRLQQARDAIDKAIALNPDDSVANAMRAFVYDWSGSAEIDDPALRDKYLSEAETAAVKALQIDPGSLLARAFYAEVLIDQQKFAQAIDNASQAAAEIPDDNIFSMDVHRVFGTVLESNAAYSQAIAEYQKAASLNPNLTFLYLRIGANYRRLAGAATTTAERQQLIDQALSAFDRAARINEQNHFEDPTPFMAIGRTYLQDGEFFIAARNVSSALAIDPGNAEIYGFLGIVYFKARNYESALPVLQCAIEGCSAAQSTALMCDLKVVACNDSATPTTDLGRDVTGLPLNSASVEYYYTYGSALAYFSGSASYPDGCARAERVFKQLMAAYGDDPIVAGIVGENRARCAGALPGATQLPLTPGPRLTPPASPAPGELMPVEGTATPESVE
jgi:tetratricopeptide (TPR) repeat protein